METQTLEVEEVMLGEQKLYSVGGWTFDEEDKSLSYIDGAIAAWTAWRAYVAEGIE